MRDKAADGVLPGVDLTLGQSIGKSRCMRGWTEAPCGLRLWRILGALWLMVRSLGFAESLQKPSSWRAVHRRARRSFKFGMDCDVC